MASLPIRVLTCNIRFAASPPGPGEANWHHRRRLVVQNLRFHTTSIPSSIICLQEVLHDQLVDIDTSLNVGGNGDVLSQKDNEPRKFMSEWEWIGAGREDGHKAGEYNPIFYKPRVWGLVEKDVRWLSPKPKEKGWDAASIRIVTMARFAHRQSGEQIVIMNTHLDDQGVVARRESARLLRQFAQEWTSRKSEQRDVAVPIVLAGDLNSQTDGDAYRLLNGHVGNDAKQCTGEDDMYGEEITYTGFEGKEKDEERLDYIFIGPPGHCSKAADVGTDEGEQQQHWRWHVRSYAVLPNWFKRDAIYSSDHRAVVADAELKQHTGGVDAMYSEAVQGQQMEVG